ncbi:DMT family transporter [Streptomyces sp. NPDC001443]
MTATLLSVVLSLFSAVAYAAAAVGQERLASRTSDTGSDSGTGTLRLLASGAWWSSVGLNAGAALLHVVALKYGPLTVVQPLGALTLVAAVPLGARLAGRRVSANEWRGTAYTLAGLAAILVMASGSAPDEVLSLPEALAVAAATAALIGLLSRPGARPGLRHATASGFASGVASALTQTVTVAATDRSGRVLSLQVIGVALLVAAFAAGGLLLAQTAYRGGLGAPLAVVTLANPMAAATIGLALLGERLRGGAPGVLLALAGAGLAAWGVVLLSRTAPERPAPVDAPGPPLPAHDSVGTVGTAGAVGTVDEEHPVAAVLALGPRTASAEPALLPRPSGPGQLTPL